MDTEETSQTQEQEEGVAALQAKCDEYLNGWKRAQADLANFRADEKKRFEEFAKFAQEGILRDMVRILDSFALAGSSMPEGDAARVGFDRIRAQLDDALRRHGLETVSAARGDLFDPSKHEAVAMEKPPERSGIPGNAVLEEIAKGYALHGKVIRPAQVKITE